MILVGRGYDQRNHRGALWDSIPTSIAYAAAHYDRATGLLLMRHRWHDPALGRWVTRDPAGYVDGMSLYLYCTGNPLAYWDPLGLFPPDSVMDQRASAVKAMTDDVAEHAAPRLGNIAVGAASGAASGAATGAAFGAAVGAIGAGVGAGPGALVGATVGAIGGAITGALQGFFSREGESLVETAENAAAGGVLDGLAGGAGSAFVKGVGILDEAVEAAGRASSAAMSVADDAVKAAGQLHHGISKKIHGALEKHPNLRGSYRSRDQRFVYRAKDKASHNGYEDWHRDLDDEVVKYVEDHPDLTPGQFEDYLRDRYNAPDLKERFPEGQTCKP